MKLITKPFFLGILAITFSFVAHPQDLASVESCYFKLEDDQLIIGNDVLTRTFKWNGGNLQNKSLTDIRNNIRFDFETGEEGFGIFGLTQKVLQADVTQKVVAQTSVIPEHLEVEVYAEYEKIEVKRVFSVYPGCPAIASNFYVRLKTNEDIQFDTAEAKLESFRFTTDHWKYRAVEFFDRTDVNNNLVREVSMVGYRDLEQMKGNILHVQDMISGNSFFILKEAPCSFVQLNYAGYDFLCDKNQCQVIGLGIYPDDLAQGRWLKTYGAVVGLSGTSELDFLEALRTYQKNVRIHRKDRDEMIMMNTWGDRNRDASISEENIKKEIKACKKYGITHLQIDDGWQQGLSKNSAKKEGKLWNDWKAEDWQPSKQRFPNDFGIIVDYAKNNNVGLGLWFNPSRNSDYQNWKPDAEVVVSLFRTYGIRYFKIDGVHLPSKKAELNLTKFFDYIAEETNDSVFLNLDATAGTRGGYHFLNRYGNIFLENRYTDFVNYYPYRTLRNLWMLSSYVPPENLQIEFLNKWRNGDKYHDGDPFAPINIPFDYQFAITLMAQPLAWFEASLLPEEAKSVIPVIKKYKEHQYKIHSGTIVPIGNEPDGKSWTGFQSISNNNNEGYLMIYREFNTQDKASIKTFLPENKHVKFELLLGTGNPLSQTTRKDGYVDFHMPSEYSYGLFKYIVKD